MTLHRTATVTLGVLLAFGAAAPLRAQRSGNGYLFGAPETQWTLRGG